MSFRATCFALVDSLVEKGYDREEARTAVYKTHKDVIYAQVKVAMLLGEDKERKKWQSTQTETVSGGVTGGGTPTTREVIKSGVMDENEPVRRCSLCGLTEVAMRHHLTPRAAGGREETCWLCHPCHEFVHAIYSVQELERSYYTLELLENSAPVARFVRGRQLGQKRELAASFRPVSERNASYV